MNFSGATEYSNMTNMSTTSSSVIQHHPSMVKISVYIVLQICSLVGNIALIIVIFRTNALKTAFNHLVVNMAISDLFVPLLVIPYKLGDELRSNGFLTDWPVDGTMGDLMCRVYWFCTDMSPAVSSFSLVAIATNRFVAIVYPFKAQLSNIMNEKNKLFIALIWMLAGLLYCPHFYFFTLSPGRKCRLSIEPKQSLSIYFGFIIIFSFFIPFTIITVEYLMMISRLHRKSESVRDCLNNKQYRSRQRRNKQIFFLSIAIILSYAFLVGPIFCYMFVINFILKWNFKPDTEMIIFVLQIIYIVYTSSNPVIYFVFVKSYRQGLKNLICGKDPNAHHPSMSSMHHISLIAKSRL